MADEVRNTTTLGQVLAVGEHVRNTTFEGQVLARGEHVRSTTTEAQVLTIAKHVRQSVISGQALTKLSISGEGKLPTSYGGGGLVDGWMTKSITLNYDGGLTSNAQLQRVKVNEPYFQDPDEIAYYGIFGDWVLPDYLSAGDTVIAFTGYTTQGSNRNIVPPDEGWIPFYTLDQPFTGLGYTKFVFYKRKLVESDFPSIPSWTFNSPETGSGFISGIGVYIGLPSPGVSFDEPFRQMVISPVSTTEERLQLSNVENQVFYFGAAYWFNDNVTIYGGGNNGTLWNIVSNGGGSYLAPYLAYIYGAPTAVDSSFYINDGVVDNEKYIHWMMEVNSG